MSEFSEHLPSAWLTARISDIADINPKVDKSELSDDLEVSFVPMPAVEELTGRMNASMSRRFAEVKKGYTPFLEGDVIFAKITPCMENGKMAIVPALRSGYGFGSTEFHVLRPYSGIDAKYLYYFVSSQRFRADAEQNMTGAVGQRRVPTQYLSGQCMPVAPSIEQRRIVAKIEELFSELDKGIETLEQTRAQLDLYRTVVLHHAVQDAKGCTYPTRPLGEVIGDISQGWSPKCELNRAPAEQEWAIIKTTAVQPMTYLPRECKPLPAELEPRGGIVISDGDLLMTRKGPRPRTGVVCYVKKARPHSMLCDTVYRFRSHEDIVLPEYLEIALNSPRVVQEIDSKKSGISESGISLNHGRIRSVSVPIPRDKEIQKHIVQVTQQRLSIVEQLDTLIREQIQKSVSVRHSILKKAFSGQLVAQHPKDEPASVLLERIRAERDGAAEDKTRNGKKGKNGKKQTT